MLYVYVYVYAAFVDTCMHVYIVAYITSTPVCLRMSVCLTGWSVCPIVLSI